MQTALEDACSDKTGSASASGWQPFCVIISFEISDPAGNMLLLQAFQKHSGHGTPGVFNPNTRSGRYARQSTHPYHEQPRDSFIPARSRERRYSAMHELLIEINNHLCSTVKLVADRMIKGMRCANGGS